MGLNRIIFLVLLFACCQNLSAQRDKSADSLLFFTNLKTGDSFYSIGRQDSARYYFRKAKDAALRDSLKGRSGFVKLNELGVAYGKMDRLDSAYDFFKKAAEINTQLSGEKKSILFAGLCKNIGDHFLLKKITDSAIDRYQNAIIQLVPEFNEQDVRLNPIEFDGEVMFPKLFEVLNLKAKTLSQKYQEDKNKNDLVASVYAYDAIFRLTDKISRDRADSLFANKNFSGYQAVESCLLLYKITKDDVFLRQAFAFAEKNRTRGGKVIEVKKLQSLMPENTGVLSYLPGDTASTIFFITKNVFKHSAIKIDSTSRIKKLSEPFPKQVSDSLGKELATVRKLLILGEDDDIISSWTANQSLAGPSKQNYLIWIMIGAACVLGIAIVRPVFKR